MIEIVVDKDYGGATIVDQQYVLRKVTAKVVDLRWTNSKAEIALLSEFSDLNFRLHVQDLMVQERTAITLGLPVEYDNHTINAAHLALNTRKSYDWRNFLEGKSHTYVRNLLLRMAADALRRGDTSALAEIVGDISRKSGIQSVDADVMLRLKVLQG